MGWIALEEMKFFANHGYYAEEQRSGNEFVVDIYIQFDFLKAAKSDELEHTINYETVYFIVQKAMKGEVKLLETLLERIANGIKFQFNGIQQLRIRLRKIRPMPGELLGSAYLETEMDYRKKCSKCQKKFSCYSDEHCWCTEEKVPVDNLKQLKQQFQGCLCPDCLRIYARS